jgi:hypothetical protein
MPMDDVELAVAVVKADWQPKELIEKILALDDCNDIKEASVLVSEVFNALRDFSIERYRQIVVQMEASAMEKSRNERVIAQGGM